MREAPLVRTLEVPVRGLLRWRNDRYFTIILQGIIGGRRRLALVTEKVKAFGCRSPHRPILVDRDIPHNTVNRIAQLLCRTRSIELEYAVRSGIHDIAVEFRNGEWKGTAVIPFKCSQPVVGGNPPIQDADSPLPEDYKIAKQPCESSNLVPHSRFGYVEKIIRGPSFKSIDIGEVDAVNCGRSATGKEAVRILMVVDKSRGLGRRGSRIHRNGGIPGISSIGCSICRINLSVGDRPRQLGRSPETASNRCRRGSADTIVSPEQT